MIKNHNIIDPTLTLEIKSQKARFLNTYHPWIFSGAIKSDIRDVENGEIVHFMSFNTIKGTGYFMDGSIAIRVLSWEQATIDAAFWATKFQESYEARIAIFKEDIKDTNIFRLINGEGDGIPGLIVDHYNDTLHLEFHNSGIASHLDTIIEGIQMVTELSNKTIVSTEKHTYLERGDHFVNVVENGIQFTCNLTNGQKTGFFIDQRVNRKLLSHYAKGKSVVNLFCYTGGFSLYALAAKASKVTSVDISKTAMDLVEQNIKLNNFDESNHTSICADVLEWIKDTQQTYDVVIVDPPAFAKSQKKKHNAVQAYKRLNSRAMQLVNKGGFMFTFSCSQVIDQDLFVNTIRSAAIETGLNARIISYLSQGPDHPINIYHGEGHYLKGLILHIS